MNEQHYVVPCVVVKVHDDECEGLPRRAIVSMVVKASGGKLSRKQAEHTWDRTIFPYGQRLGLLTGYVRPQDGTSKRTAADNIDLQRQWHELCDDMFQKIQQVVKEILKDDDLVHKMMPHLVFNLDESCLHALGKNEVVAGSKDKKKTW